MVPWSGIALLREGGQTEAGLPECWRSDIYFESEVELNDFLNPEILWFYKESREETIYGT